MNHGLERLAVIGTGLTGAPLALRLAQKARVVAWDRDPGNLALLEREGIESADSAREAAAGSAFVLIDVLDDDAVRSVCDGDRGLLAGLDAGAMVVDLSTTSEETKRWEAEEVGSRGGRFVEAPFFGSVPQVEQGEIWTVVGCAEAHWPVARALLERFSVPIRVGDVGEATRFKLAANVLTFSMVQLIAEAIALARALEVDPERLLEVLATGTGVRAPIYQAKGRAMIDGDFSPKATVELAGKDLRLILDAARRRGLSLPVTSATLAQFERAAQQGWGKSDMARVIELLESGGS